MTIARSARQPLVSIVVPNYNGKGLLEKCLRSLHKSRFPTPKLEIVVVDNGSTDGSKELVARKFGSVRLVSLSTNSGFASAVNLGVKASRGQYVAMVNNDVEVTRDWLSQLLLAIQENPQIAVVTGKLLLRNNPRIVNDLGGTILLSGAGFQRGLGGPDREMCRKPVGVPSGAACLIHRRDFLEMGGFDDTYFVYFEDVDLGWRLWQRGRRVEFVPSAVAYHHWRATSRKLGTSFRAYHGSKNSLANLIKNAQRRYILEAAILWTLRSAMHVFPPLGTGVSALATLRALCWCARNFRALFARRMLIQPNRKVTDTDLMKLGILGGLREALSEARRLRTLSPLITGFA